MKAGITIYFQHPNYLEEKDGPTNVPDQGVIHRDLAIAEAAEGLGYDSLWSVEHHFSGYTMVPDVTQLLAYLAGRTRNIELGSAAIILPWHNPVRVADSVALLDNLSNGRYVLGIGRGLGRIEFDGIGVPMGESRERFVEAAQIVLNGLENGYVEFDGKHYKQEKRWIRPAPTRSFKGRSYAAAVSPESQEIMARLGVGILIAPQKPWDTTIREHNSYREMYEKINGHAAPQPIVTCQCYVDRYVVRAKDRALLHISDYYRFVMKHYELGGSHLDSVKDYEYYAKAKQNIGRIGDDQAALNFAELQVYGTPAECLGRIEAIRDKLDCQAFNAILSYSTMDDDEANANMKLWTEEVLPKIKKMGRSAAAPKSGAAKVA